MAFVIYVTAGDSFLYSSNIALANNQSWTSNAFITSLDLNDIFDTNNNEVGVLTCNLSPIITNTPNSINYTLTLSATPNATIYWISNTVNPIERTLYLFTKYTSNTGNIAHGNTLILRVKAAPIS